MRPATLYLLVALATGFPATSKTTSPSPQANVDSPYCGPCLAVAKASPLNLYGTINRLSGVSKSTFTPYIARPDNPRVPLDSHTYLLSNWYSDFTDKVEMRTSPMQSITPNTKRGYIGGNLLSYHLQTQDCSGVGLHLVTGVPLSRVNYLKFDYSQVWNQSGEMDLKAPAPSVSLGFRY